MNKFLILLLYIFLLSGCSPVKEYQKSFLNDRDMDLGDSKTEDYEANFESYREGAIGGRTKSGGGGCGCN